MRPADVVVDDAVVLEDLRVASAATVVPPYHGEVLGAALVGDSIALVFWSIFEFIFACGEARRSISHADILLQEGEIQLSRNFVLSSQRVPLEA